MTNCPPRLRGDLSKWLCEINTGVYVGNVSGRVRDALWDRVCQNLKNGQATLVFTAAGEQKMDFRTYNTTWEAVDFDGIKLMRKPLPQIETGTVDLKPGFSKAAKQRYANRKPLQSKPQKGDDYTIIDLETTGLKAVSGEIIEYGAVRIRNGMPVEEMSMLVRCTKTLTDETTKLTGIQEKDLKEGMEPKQALKTFLNFIGKDTLVGHTISFDMEFLRAACKHWEFPAPANKCVDVATLARRKLYRVQNYKLVTLAQHFQLTNKVEHRALADCRLVYRVYCKLNESATG